MRQDQMENDRIYFEILNIYADVFKNLDSTIYDKIKNNSQIDFDYIKNSKGIITKNYEYLYKQVINPILYENKILKIKDTEFKFRDLEQLSKMGENNVNIRKAYDIIVNCVKSLVSGIQKIEEELKTINIKDLTDKIKDKTLDIEITDEYELKLNKLMQENYIRVKEKDEKKEKLKLIHSEIVEKKITLNTLSLKMFRELNLIRFGNYVNYEKFIRKIMENNLLSDKYFI